MGKNNSQPTILAIESSCDDTAAAVLRNGKIHSNCVSTQLDHQEYGGVVPELASRKHQQKIVPVVQKALEEAQTSLDELDAVACTQGPGLLGSLLVGYSFAKGLALSRGIPLINVDHIEAHIWAHYIGADQPLEPMLCLLVSGGHTQLVHVASGRMEVLGKTLDDAAGEAFDKAGKMLGLPYPAGPELDSLAQEGDPTRFSFSTARTGELDFSFSGLKTSILYFLQKEVAVDPDFVQKNLNDLSASIQHTIVSYLMSKMKLALEQRTYKSIGVAGGVAANSELRRELDKLAREWEVKAYLPQLDHCTDNAAMIAQAALYQWQNRNFGTLADHCYTRNETNH